MVKKKKSQANPAIADPNEEDDIFGATEPLPVGFELSPEDLASPENQMVLASVQAFNGLPLNQVPGKLRKFLTPKDTK